MLVFKYLIFHQILIRVLSLENIGIFTLFEHHSMFKRMVAAILQF